MNWSEYYEIMKYDDNQIFIFQLSLHVTDVVNYSTIDLLSHTSAVSIFSYQASKNCLIALVKCKMLVTR